MANLDIKDFPRKTSLNDADRLIITDASTGLIGAAITTSDFKANVVDPEVEKMVELLVVDQQDIDAVKAEIEGGVNMALNEGLNNIQTSVNSSFANINATIDDKIAEGVADSVAKPLAISGNEQKAGTYSFGGESIDIYEKTVKLEALPKTANEIKEYIISDEPLGYGLYFNVESFIASSGKNLKGAFFNSNYEISKCYVNDSMESVIEVTCKRAVTEDIYGLLHAQYCKFYGDIVEFDVTVPAGVDKNAVTLEIPPLKYNKKLVFSYITDDSYSIYNYIFAGINKRFVAYPFAGFFHLNMPNEENGFYPDAFRQCTDGAGIKHRYATTVACWPDKLKDQSIGQDVGKFWLWISEKEFKFFQDFGFMLGYHDIIGYNINTTDTQAKFDKCMEDTVALFKEYVGITPKILVEPNGDKKYVEFGRGNDTIQAITAQTEVDKIYPFRQNVTLDKMDVIIERLFWYGSNTEYPSDLMNKLAEFHSISDKDNIYWLIGSAHESDKWETDFIKNIHELYGDIGDDSLWFPTLDEMYEYWYMRMNTLSVKSITSGGIHYKLYVPKRQNFFFRDLSVMLSGITSITGVSVSSSDNVYGTSAAINDGKLLVNLNFDEKLIQRAEKYVSALEAAPNAEYAYDNAIYFVQQLKTGVKEPYMARISALTSAPVLSSVSINAGAASTQSNIVALTLAYTGQSPTHYMASESSDFSGASWQTYNSNPSFTLSSSFGNKTVYVKLRNAYGESNSMSDSITLLEPTLTLNSVIINSGDAATSIRTILLSFNYVGYPTHYMASESSDFSGASWQTFTANPSFTLSADYGVKTVYVKLKNATTTTAVKNDTIELIDNVTVRLNSIVINNGDAGTVSQILSVALSITNTATKYKIGEQADLSDCPNWINYTGSPVSYTTAKTEGTVTLYVQVANDSSTSEIKNDSISLVQAVALNSISLAGGAENYAGKNVPVSFSTTGGTPSHYRLAETSAALSSAAWIAWSTSVVYAFASIGSKTLYGQVKNAAGESAVVNDTITLTEAPLRVVIGFNGTSNGNLQTVVSNGDTISQIARAIYEGYGQIQLKDTDGNLVPWYWNANTSYYQANTIFPDSGNNDFQNSGTDSTANDSGVYPKSVFLKCFVTDALKKMRSSLILPAGTYRIRILFSAGSGWTIPNENTRQNSHYGVYQGTTELISQVVGSAGFTGLNNNQYNNTLEFTITDGSTAIDIAAWNTVSAGYCPGMNLIEISKLS